MEPSLALSLVALAFSAFGLLLLVTPLFLVTKKVRKWQEVVGLWIAGWGFLFIAVGTHFAYRGWSGAAVAGVVITTVGHLMQRRAMKK